MPKASLEEIRRMKDAGQLVTDLVAAEPEDLGPDFWKDAMVVEPRPPRPAHLKVDPER